VQRAGALMLWFALVGGRSVSQITIFSDSMQARFSVLSGRGLVDPLASDHRSSYFRST
jgi:hypothetical protein